MKKYLSNILFYGGPLAGLILYFLPLGLNHQQQTLASIMIGVAAWWLHPSLPLAVTGLLGVSLATVFGVSDFASALRGFSNPVIFLFMGGFFLARAMHLHGLDVWIAKESLSSRLVKGSPKRVMMAIALLAAILSGFLSNTATTAMFVPIAMSLLGHLKVHEDHGSYPLLLMIAYAATIGGVLTPLGSPPNVIAISMLDNLAHLKFGFMEWVIKMAPLMIFSMLGLFLIFHKELKNLPVSQTSIFKGPNPLTAVQKKLIIVLLATVLLWVIPGVLQLILGNSHALVKSLSERLPEGLVAIAMASTLFIIPAAPQKKLLSWEEAQKIDWGTLLLFGSGISLGQMMFESGLAGVIGSKLPFQEMNPMLALALITGLTLFSTEFVSNTATANLLIPLVITTPPFNHSPLLPVLCVSLAANMAFMLPVGTPPNAIVYGSGKIKLQWMLKKGLMLNLMCLLFILLTVGSGIY